MVKPIKPTKVAVNISLTDGVREAAERYAEARGLTLSSIVEQYLRELTGLPSFYDDAAKRQPVAA